MDALLRGICEKYIDELIEPAQVSKLFNLVEILDIPNELRMNFVLGYLLGSLNSHLESYCLAILNRLPSNEEINSMHSILKRRMSESKFSNVENNVGELERLKSLSEYYHHESKNSISEKDEVHNETSTPENF
jgi:hypothetical protein